MPGRFNLNDYEQVQDRLKRFWAACPSGRIDTEVTHSTADHKSVIIKARVFKDIADPFPVASGIAEETAGGSGANSTSHVENCETSAIGRALANWTYSGDKRASREEMQKANREPASVPPAFPSQRPQAPRPAADTVDGEIKACFKCRRPVRYAVNAEGKQDRFNADGTLHYRVCSPDNATGYETDGETDPFAGN